MSIPVTCPKCSSEHNVHERLAGKEIRCPHCNELVTIPAVPASSGDRELQSDDRAELQRPQVTSSRGDKEVVAAKGSKKSAQKPSGVPAGASLSSESNSRAGNDSFQPDLPTSEPTITLDEEDVEDISFPPKELPKDDMDMTPMVDVTFLLLIFFMITASFSSEKVFEEPKPLSDKPSNNVQENPPPVLDTVRVQIDEFNGYTIILPGGDEREANSKQDLLLALGDAKAEVSTGANDDQLKMIVEAHTESIHAAVVAALDAGREKGFNSFQVQVLEELE